jgi:hypothetical protein
MPASPMNLNLNTVYSNEKQTLPLKLKEGSINIEIGNGDKVQHLYHTWD